LSICRDHESMSKQHNKEIGIQQDEMDRGRVFMRREWTSPEHSGPKVVWVDLTFKQMEERHGTHEDMVATGLGSPSSSSRLSLVLR